MCKGRIWLEEKEISSKGRKGNWFPEAEPWPKSAGVMLFHPGSGHGRLLMLVCLDGMGILSLRFFLLSPHFKTQDLVWVWWERAECTHGLFQTPVEKLPEESAIHGVEKLAVSSGVQELWGEWLPFLKSFPWKEGNNFFPPLASKISSPSDMKIWREMKNQALCGENFQNKVSWVAD